MARPRRNPRAMTFRKAESPSSPSEPVTQRHLFGKKGKPPLVAEPLTACSVCHAKNGLAQRGGVCCDCREAAGEKWCDVCEAPAAEGFSVGASLVCKKHADALLAEAEKVEPRAECPGCGTQVWLADGPFCTGCRRYLPGRWSDDLR